MDRVLLVGHDRAWCGHTARGLVDAGFDVIVASASVHADIGRDGVDPGCDALVVAAEDPAGARQLTATVRAVQAHGHPGAGPAVVVVLPPGAVVERIAALDAGADALGDLGAAHAELAARVRAALRRLRAQDVDRGVLRAGAVELLLMSRQVTVHGTRVRMTVREFDVLREIVGGGGALVERTELIDALRRDGRSDPGSNVVDVIVGRVRRKLAPLDPGCRIDTVRGRGFRVVAAPAAAGADQVTASTTRITTPSTTR